MQSIKRHCQLTMESCWIAIHEDKLMADWKLAIDGQDLFLIDPLK